MASLADEDKDEDDVAEMEWQLDAHMKAFEELATTTIFSGEIPTMCKSGRSESHCGVMTMNKFRGPVLIHCFSDND